MRAPAQFLNSSVRPDVPEEGRQVFQQITTLAIEDDGATLDCGTLCECTGLAILQYASCS